MGDVIHAKFGKPTVTYTDPPPFRKWTAADAQMMLVGITPETKVSLTGTEAKDLFEHVLRLNTANAWIDAAVERLTECKQLVDQIRENLSKEGPDFESTEAAFIARSVFLTALINSREVL